MMIAPTLHTSRLTLRPLTARDFPAVEAFYASDRAAYVGGQKDAVHAWRHFAMEIGHWTLLGFGRWGVEITETGEFIGLVGLYEPNGYPEAELAWDLMQGSEGKGYATEAALAARDWAYDTFGLTTLISLIHPENRGSRNVALRLGATMEGQYDLSTVGDMEIWRHASADELAPSTNPEAAA